MSKTLPSNLMSPIWQKNDWCFHNFELCIILRVLPRPNTETIVRLLSNGHFEITGEFNGVIFPLDLEGKIISDKFKDATTRFLSETENLSESINHTGIREWIIEKWLQCMKCRHSDPQKSHILLEEVEDFVDEVLEVITKNQTVKGVKIFL